MICTTPVVTLVVVLELAPEIVVIPGAAVMGVRLNAPESETIPFRLIFPVPAFRVVLAARITPVLKIMSVFVAATVPLIVIEDGAVTIKPPVKVVVSPEPLFKVTVPVLRNSTFCTKVLPVPVMLMVVAVIVVVIKSLTVTAPVNAAEAPLVMVKLLMATVVPVMAPTVPAFRPRLKAPLMPALKVIAAPVAELPALVVSIADELVVNVTVLLKITSSEEVVIFTPAMVAALATVNALLKEEAVVAKVTPVPPAVNVVIPLMVPPPDTAFTVIVPAPPAVIFNEPAAVMKSSSASVRLNPAPTVPKNTFTAELLVTSIAPVTFIAAPIKISPALAIVSAESSLELPTVPVKVTVPVPAVRPRDCVPSSVLLKTISSPAINPVIMVTPLVKVTPRRNEMPSLVLAMLPPMLLRPAPS